MDYDDPEPHNWTAEQWHTIADERSAALIAALADAQAFHDLVTSTEVALKAAEARIAELEGAIEMTRGAWQKEELAWQEREQSIARAVAELESWAAAGGDDDAPKRALEALR